MEREMSSIEAMNIAVVEAYKGWGKVAPNPMVGCVILSRDRKLLAKGHHARHGGPHAEIDAISKITNKEMLKGAHVYVTLEPCAHKGKTGSCARALVSEKVGSVTYGLKDPNPLVAGQGVEILRKAGIEVTCFRGLERECEEVAEIFLFNQRYKRPFVALKTASTLDGVCTLNNGNSQWITGREARDHVHFLRAQFDAILVGRGTIEADDPSMNIRHSEFEGKRNKVLIIDPTLQLVSGIQKTNVWRSHSPDEIIFVADRGTEEQEMFGCQRISVDQTLDGNLNIEQILDRLYEKAICSIFIEGGARTYGTFLSHIGAVQRLYQYVSPSVLGLGGGRGWSEGFNVSSLDERRMVKETKVVSIGNDILITGRF